MKKSLSRFERRIVGQLLVLTCSVSVRAQSGKRLATVVDAIEMTRLADSTYSYGGDPNHIGLFSPDHRKVVVTLEKGDLASGFRQSSILLFDSEKLSASVLPKTLITMQTATNYDAIVSPHWMGDSKTLVFIGYTASDGRQVYSLNTQTLAVETLTHHDAPVVGFDISQDGRTLVFEAEPKATAHISSSLVARRGIVMDEEYPMTILAAECTKCDKPLRENRELYVQEGPAKPRKVDIAAFLTEVQPLSISPDGGHVLVQAYLGEAPRRWIKYQDQLLRPYILEVPKPGTPSNVMSIFDVNTKDLTVSSLLDAPMSWFDEGIAWGKDGKSVVVSGSYLPLNVDEGKELERREQSTAVVEISVPDHHVTRVADGGAVVTSWDWISGVLQLTHKDSGAITGYQRKNGVWVQDDAGSTGSSHTDPLITLDEDNNHPPVLDVQEIGQTGKSLLYDLNPAFKEIKFAEEKPISWKAADGHKARGGIYIPPEYESGRRYPLVIQTHGYNPKRFWISGPWDGAFAAQALASCGIVVVQTDETVSRDEYKEFWNTPEEGSHEMDMYEGLIDSLDQQGMIDRQRVGIIGFSRTVYHVGFTITHSKYRFAAATLADGFDGSFSQYLFFHAIDGAKVNGGDPFGPEVATWLKNAPDFHLNQVNAAVRIESYGPVSIIGGWTWYSGLSGLKKPVDLIWLPNATHIVVKPWERYTSEQGDVDWFRFWLQGYERPNPEDPDQYKRWEHLRELRDADAKQSPSY